MQKKLANKTMTYNRYKRLSRTNNTNNAVKSARLVIARARDINERSAEEVDTVVMSLFLNKNQPTRPNVAMMATWTMPAGKSNVAIAASIAIVVCDRSG